MEEWMRWKKQSLSNVKFDKSCKYVNEAIMILNEWMSKVMRMLLMLLKQWDDNENVNIWNDEHIMLTS
jgi:hypothetical protein